MSNELKVHYYLRRNEVRIDGTAPVLGRISIGQSMAQFSAKVNVRVSLWDTKSGRAIGKSKEAAELNRTLDKINLSIHIRYKELLKLTNHVTAMDVKNAFQGIASQQETLIGYYHKHIGTLEKRVEVNLTLASFNRYGISLNHLKRFLRAKYNLSDIPFRALDYAFIEAFDFYLRVERKLAHNTIIGILGHLKLVIKTATHNGVIIHNPFIDFKLEQEPAKPKSLTRQQLRKLMTTPLDKPNHYLVRDMFLFSTFTGLAFSDVRNLTHRNLSQAQDGVWWIHTKRQKTGVECHIPLMELPLQLIEKYRGIAKGDKLFVMLSCSKTNLHLKVIAKKCGIEPINYHQSRHTYASLITLSQGVPMETVSSMLGHSDLRATRIYAEVSNEKIDTDMRKLERRISNRYHLAE